MSKNIIYSCVVDEDEKFIKQCKIFVRSLIQLAKIEPGNIFVHLTYKNNSFQRYLESMGINVRLISKFGDNKYCNKLAQFENEKLLNADYIFLCDCDLAFADSIANFVEENSDCLLGKTVDQANPPIEKLNAIFEQYSIKKSSVVSTFSGDTLETNWNGGFLGFPKHRFKEFGKLWRNYALSLLNNREVMEGLGSWSIHVDQISFSMTLAKLQAPFKVLSLHYNTPIHMSSVFPRVETLLENISPKIIHYHSAVNDQGQLNKTGIDLIDISIAKINALQSQCDTEKSKLFIHIGSPKTGTTALQLYLRNNEGELAKLGVNYPKVAMDAMNYLAFSLLDSLPRHVHRLDCSAKALYNSISYKKGINVISAEAFYVCSTSKYLGQELPRRLKALLPTNIDVKIMIYLRPHREFISSIYAQYIKLHAHNLFYTQNISQFIEEYSGYLRYAETLDNWVAVFGKDNIIIHRYDTLREDNVDISTDFMSILGMGATNRFSNNNGLSNVSLARDGIEFKRLMNALSLPDGCKIKALPQILQKIEWSTEKYNYFQAHDIQRMVELTAADRVALEQRYLLQFEEPKLDTELKCYPGISYKTLTHIFASIALLDVDLFKILKSAVNKGLRSEVNHEKLAAEVLINGLTKYTDSKELKLMEQKVKSKKQSLQAKSLIISGFHRSATSATAHYLQVAGLNLGTHLMAGGISNPKGHFEDWPAVHMHDALLSESGSNWQFHDEVELNSSLEPIKQYIETRSKTAKQWGVKDPRALLFLNEWQQAQGGNGNFLFVVRHWSSCIESLLHRHSREFAHALTDIEVDNAGLQFWLDQTLAAKMWLSYNKRLLAFAKKNPDKVLVVSQRALFEGAPILSALNKKFQFELNQDATSPFDSNLFRDKADISIVEALSYSMKAQLDLLWNELLNIADFKSTNEEPVYEAGICVDKKLQMALDHEINSFYTSMLSAHSSHSVDSPISELNKESAAKWLGKLIDNDNSEEISKQLDSVTQDLLGSIDISALIFHIEAIFSLNGTVCLSLAKLLLRAQQHEFALSYFEKVITLGVHYPFIDTMIAQCYQNMAKYQQALFFFDRAIKGNPKNSTFYINKAKYLLVINEDSCAEENFKQGIKLGGSSPAAVLPYCEYLLQAGRFVESQALLDENLKSSQIATVQNMHNRIMFAKDFKIGKQDYFGQIKSNLYGKNKLEWLAKSCLKLSSVADRDFIQRIVNHWREVGL